MSESFQTYPGSGPDPEAENAGGQVVPFPVRPSQPDQDAEADQSQAATGTPTADADQVIEGVIVGAQDATPALWKAWRQSKRAARSAKTVLRWLLAHRATRFGARQAAYVLSGVRTWVRRYWESRTTTRHEQMMRNASAGNDHTSALEWEKRAAEFRAARHQRRMDLLSSPVRIASGLVHGLIATVLMLGILGIALAVTSHHAGQVVTPFTVAFQVIRDAIAVVNATWRPVLEATPFAMLAGAWATGRNKAELPGWLALPEPAELDVTIDESTIARALKALRIPQITAHLKAGMPIVFLTPPRVDGRGTHAVLRLPEGVSAEKIAKRRLDLSTGLYRAAKEVWPSTGSEAGILDLWVADKGALSEGAGPYPLLAEGAVDVFKGVPFGRTLRGDPIAMPVMGRNGIAGGMPEQGKSSAARVAFAGIALDPTCELRIWVPDANFDFEAFKPRCSSYIMGAEDEKIRAIRDQLKALEAEIQHRGRLLIQYGEPEVTRKLADRGVGLHPIACLLEEAHIAINHAKYGKEISQLLIDNVKLCRKRGIFFFVSTQAPTSKSMPRDVTRNCTVGIAFAVGDHVANDALLGEGAHKAGHRATELIPGTDRGTCLTKGFAGESRSQVVQVYFISVSSSNDQITPIIKRSLAAIEATGQPVPGTGKPDAVPVEAVRDLLADVLKVMGGATLVKSSEIAAGLADLDPNTYAGLTANQLNADLAPDGVIARKTRDGTMHVDRAQVETALSIRAEEQLDTDADGAENADES
jgi:DNA segregation ATPase FtsK/SpoIIIE, S-DNA-T family